MNETDKHLCQIFDKILAGNDPELRDMVITYIALVDFVPAVDILLEYLSSETLAWLQNYAMQVVEHLEKLRKGIPSKPPIVSDQEITSVGIKRRS